MIFPYPELHEMDRVGDTFRCSYCEQAYIFKGGKLQILQSGDIDKQHYYYSSEIKIGVKVKQAKELGDD